MDRNSKCHAIIHSASVAAGGVGAGLAQLPFADAIPLSGIQITMVISLGEVFEIELTESSAKGILSALAASCIGPIIAGSGITAQFIGVIPVYGNALKATTAATITEAIGWGAVKHFENQEFEKRTQIQQGIDIGLQKFHERIKISKNKDIFLLCCLKLSLLLLINKEEGREYISNILDGVDYKTKKKLKIEDIDVLLHEKISFDEVRNLAEELDVDDIKALNEIVGQLKGMYKINNVEENNWKSCFDEPIYWERYGEQLEKITNTRLFFLCCCGIVSKILGTPQVKDSSREKALHVLITLARKVDENIAQAEIEHFFSENLSIESILKYATTLDLNDIKLINSIIEELNEDLKMENKIVLDIWYNYVHQRGL